jgi:AraC-like DNA-binding protein
MTKPAKISVRSSQDISGMASTLSRALDVPVHFSPADKSGLVWLDQSIRQSPFCQSLNRCRVVCRRCSSACFPSACFKLDDDDRLGTAVFRFSCMMVMYLVTPVTIDGTFRGVLGCGPILLERPTRESFERMLAGLGQPIPPGDQPALWRGYRKTPYLHAAKIKAIASLLPDLAQMIGTHAPQDAPSQFSDPGDSGVPVDRMLQLIQQQCGGPLTLKSVAKQIDVSAAHLSRSFSQLVGMPFHVYLNHARVARASALMQSTSCKCIDIARQSGFNSKAAFNRWFVKLTGRSPRTFRLPLK